MGYLRDQRQHYLPDPRMFAASGIAQTDDLDQFRGPEDGILPPVAGHIGPLCANHHWRGLGTAGGQQYQGDKGFHPLSLAGIG